MTPAVPDNDWLVEWQDCVPRKDSSGYMERDNPYDYKWLGFVCIANNDRLMEVINEHRRGTQRDWSKSFSFQFGPVREDDICCQRKFAHCHFIVTFANRVTRDDAREKICDALDHLNLRKGERNGFSYLASVYDEHLLLNSEMFN